MQAGVVGAAPDRAEGSQQRRKRKREAQEGAAPAPLLGGVQWANPAAYKRAFRCDLVAQQTVYRSYSASFIKGFPPPSCTLTRLAKHCALMLNIPTA